MQGRNAIGIDAGASLWKLFCAHENPEVEVLAAGAVEDVQHWLARRAPMVIGITGVQARAVVARLNPVQCFQVDEFEAWGLGAPVLAELESVVLPEHYLLVSIGTGTSILEIRSGELKRVSGSPLGGGTFLKLSRFFGYSVSFSDLLALASRGERERVDLLVRDIVPHAENLTLASDDTVASFGKLESKEPADLLHALIWLIGENIGILCNAIARPLALQTIVFGGGTLAGNQILKEVLRKTLSDQANSALFFHDGIFCGAAGAAFRCDSFFLRSSALK